MGNAIPWESLPIGKPVDLKAQTKSPIPWESIPIGKPVDLSAAPESDASPIAMPGIAPEAMSSAPVAQNYTTAPGALPPQPAYVSPEQSASINYALSPEGQAHIAAEQRLAETLGMANTPAPTPVPPPTVGPADPNAVIPSAQDPRNLAVDQQIRERTALDNANAERTEQGNLGAAMIAGAGSANLLHGNAALNPNAREFVPQGNVENLGYMAMNLAGKLPLFKAFGATGSAVKMFAGTDALYAGTGAAQEGKPAKDIAKETAVAGARGAALGAALNGAQAFTKPLEAFTKQALDAGIAGKTEAEMAKAVNRARFINGLAGYAAETGVFATVPALTEGRLPQGQEFLDSALAIGMFRMAGVPEKQIRDDFYAKKMGEAYKVGAKLNTLGENVEKPRVEQVQKLTGLDKEQATKLRDYAFPQKSLELTPENINTATRLRTELGRNPTINEVRKATGVKARETARDILDASKNQELGWNQTPPQQPPGLERPVLTQETPTPQALPEPAKPEIAPPAPTVAAERPVAPRVSREGVQKAFPGAKVETLEDGKAHRVTVANGAVIEVRDETPVVDRNNPDAVGNWLNSVEQVLTPEEKTAWDGMTPEQRLSWTDEQNITPGGSQVTFDGKTHNVDSLIKAVRDGELPHESMHAWIKLAATDAQYKSFMKHYGTPEGGLNEEAVVRGYQSTIGKDYKSMTGAEKVIQKVKEKLGDFAAKLTGKADLREAYKAFRDVRWDQPLVTPEERLARGASPSPEPTIEAVRSEPVAAESASAAPVPPQERGSRFNKPAERSRGNTIFVETKAQNEAVWQWRKDIENGGVRPPESGSKEDFGTNWKSIPFREGATKSWDQWAQHLTEAGLLPQDPTMEDFANFFVGRNRKVKEIDLNEAVVHDIERAPESEVINEASLGNDALVFKNGEWHKAEPNAEGGTDLVDGERIKIKSWDDIMASGVVRKGEGGYKKALYEYNKQEKGKARAHAAPKLSKEAQFAIKKYGDQISAIHAVEAQVRAQRENGEKVSPSSIKLLQELTGRQDEMFGEILDEVKDDPFYQGDAGELFSAIRETKPDEAKKLDQSALVRLGKVILGSTPDVVKKMRGNAIGRFYHNDAAGKGRIALEANIFHGPVLTSITTRAKLFGDQMEAAKEQIAQQFGCGTDEIITEIARDKKSGKYVTTFYQRDHEYANRVIAHEIGHAADWVPEKSMNRGNILGRIASLKGFMRGFMNDVPPEEPHALDAKTRAKKRNQIRREVKSEAGAFADKDEINRETSERYEEWVSETAEYEGILRSKEVREELVNLSAWWRGDGGENALKNSKEMYADFLSVILNDPQAAMARAPRIYKAWDAYLSRKPEVRAMYDQIQSELRGDTKYDERAEVRAMFKRGDAVRSKMADRRAEENKATFKQFWHDLKYTLVDSRAGLPEAAVRALSEVAYLGTSNYQMQIEVRDRILKPLSKAGIEDVPAELGELVFYNRIMNDRKDIANSLGTTEEKAAELRDKMRVAYGDEKFAALEKAADEFWKIRNEYTIKEIERSGITDPEMMEHIKLNKDYATWDVIDYMDKRTGGRKGDALGSGIWRQVGTLKEIANPLFATLQKDMSLQFTAAMNNAKIIMLKEVDSTPAETQWDGNSHRPIPPADPNLALVNVLENGKMRGYYVNKDIARIYEDHPVYGNGLSRAMSAMSMPFKRMFTVNNPAFGPWNAWRDFWSSVSSLPSDPRLPSGFAELAQPLEQLFAHMQAVPSAYKAAFKDESTPFTKKVMDNRGMIAGRQWTGRDDTVGERLYDLMEEFEKSPNKRRNFLYRAGKAVFSDGNEFFEKLGKLGGAKYLENTQGKDNIDWEMVRTRAGSPDFLAGGAWRGGTNSLFMFSNAAIQADRANLKAFQEAPKSYTFKRIAFDVMPKVFMFAIAKGWMGDKLKEIYDKIPEFDKMMYNVLPWGVTAAGKAAYSCLPADHLGQIIGAYTWQGLRAMDGQDGMGKAVAKTTVSLNPYSSISPLPSAAWDMVRYMTTGNIYDAYRGNMVLGETEETAGGKYAAKGIARYEFNQMFGSSVFYLPKNSEHWYGSNITEYPVVGPMFRRFLRFSDRGESEATRAEEAPAKREKASQTADITAVFNRYYKPNGDHTMRARDATFNAAKAKGEIPKGYPQSAWNARWKNAGKR